MEDSFCMGVMGKMLTFVDKYKGGQYSQNGEAGIIDECLRRMKITVGTSVEFGAPTLSFCSNTHHLPNTWTKYYLDPEPQEAGIVKAFITPGNINEMIPADVDVLSMDTDGINDFESWKEYRGKAKIVVIEINSSKPPTMPYLGEGASYMSMLLLGLSKGYFLLCHTGNLLFILNEYKDLFPEITGNPITDIEKYFNTSWIS